MANRKGPGSRSVRNNVFQSCQGKFCFVKAGGDSLSTERKDQYGGQSLIRQKSKKQRNK